MAHRDGQIETYNSFDTELSSGDSNKTQPISKQLYKEENNNEIDELSKDLDEMGCIVDVVKRPPNICVETCVFAESSSESEDENQAPDGDDAYSDEFEDDKSEAEEVDTIEPISAQSKALGADENEINNSPPASNVKLSKSQSFMSSRAPGSVSGKSSNFGSSMSVPRTRRVNMSFSNERLREIERHNHILLNKILSARNSRKSSIPPPREEQPKRPMPAAAVQRKKQQRQIDHDNMILLKKLQRAKSSSYSVRH